MSKSKKSKMPSEAKATKLMPLFCFEVLDHALQGKSHPKYPKELGVEPSLLFVTWRKGKHSELASNALRGCKGTLSAPQSLNGLLRHMALNAAFDDSRFQPISLDEFPKLHCEVSLLHSFEPAADCYDWEVGLHGIDIDVTVFADSSRIKSIFTGHAIFLPTVAPEFGWDTHETVEHLVRKAGYKGPVDLSLMDIHTTRHQSSHAHVSYADYTEWLSHKDS
jgi:uncharacterized protein (TIGR00296 family)